MVANSCCREALELFSDLPEQFDLIITDYQMPEMDGAQLCKKIQIINPGIPIIMCSGYASEFSETDAASIGVKWFVRKPLMKRDFVEVIGKALSGNQ